MKIAGSRLGGGIHTQLCGLHLHGTAAKAASRWCWLTNS
jgi:hypothetical protein